MKVVRIKVPRLLDCGTRLDPKLIPADCLMSTNYGVLGYAKPGMLISVGFRFYPRISNPILENAPNISPRTYQKICIFFSLVNALAPTKKSKYNIF